MPFIIELDQGDGPVRAARQIADQEVIARSTTFTQTFTDDQADGDETRPLQLGAPDGLTTSRPAPVQSIVDPSAVDTVPPSSLWTEPVGGAAGVIPSAEAVMADCLGAIYGPLPTIQFSEPISVTTLTTQTVRLEDATGRTLSISLGFNTAFNQLLILPREPLRAQTVYTLTLSAGITDLADNPLAAPSRAAGPRRRRSVRRLIGHRVS